MGIFALIRGGSTKSTYLLQQCHAIRSAISNDNGFKSVVQVVVFVLPMPHATSPGPQLQKQYKYDGSSRTVERFTLPLH